MIPPGPAWLVAGLLLAGLEMALPGVFLLWIGLAAIGTGAATALFALGWHAQLASFVVLTLLLVGLIGLRLRRRPTPDRVNAPAANLLGRTCRAMDFSGQDGRVVLGDGTWQARALGPPPVPGDTLRVTGLEGTTLLVGPIPGPLSPTREGDPAC